MASCTPLKLTRKLLSYNTINPPGNERQCAHFIGKLLGQGGFSVDYHEFAKGRNSLVARLTDGENSEPLCFSGHLDTVPLGNTEWALDPFRGERDGDKLFGRGASDMKSGVAAWVSIFAPFRVTKIEAAVEAYFEIAKQWCGAKG